MSPIVKFEKELRDNGPKLDDVSKLSGRFGRVSVEIKFSPRDD